MELVVASKHHLCEITTALDITGREHLVIATKASWKIPSSNQRPKPLPPTPLNDADSYYGEPGDSSMRYGDDFARFKPRCDVLFDAIAHTPDGAPRRYLDVAVQVGPMHKHIQVVGHRVWKRGALGFVPSDPETFTEMPLHYGNAFGGIRSYQNKGQTAYEALLNNPIGKGWAGSHTWRKMEDEPLPNLEHPKEPVRSPEGKNTPIALTAIPPAWPSRIRYGGTFDDVWAHDVAPFLPEDFDDRFNQCAPQDQQIDYPKGGEDVVLQNLVPGQPVVRFKLPPLSNMKIRVLRKDYSTETLDAHADTLFFEPQEKRFSVIWRASTPIRRRLQEFETIAVGAVDLQWWSNRSLGITGEGCAGCTSREVR